MTSNEVHKDFSERHAKQYARLVARFEAIRKAEIEAPLLERIAELERINRELMREIKYFNRSK